MLAVLIATLMFFGEASAQTKVVFEKGSSSKTITVTVPAKKELRYSLAVGRGQVINVGIEGDVSVSRTNDFPVIWLQLGNAVENVDQWQDGEGYLSVLAGRKAGYVIVVGNSSNRARTFRMKFSVTDDPDDYAGGTEVEQ